MDACVSRYLNCDDFLLWLLLSTDFRVNIGSDRGMLFLACVTQENEASRGHLGGTRARIQSPAQSLRGREAGMYVTVRLGTFGWGNRITQRRIGRVFAALHTLLQVCFFPTWTVLEGGPLPKFERQVTIFRAQYDSSTVGGSPATFKGFNQSPKRCTTSGRTIRGVLAIMRAVENRGVAVSLIFCFFSIRLEVHKSKVVYGKNRLSFTPGSHTERIVQDLQLRIIEARQDAILVNIKLHSLHRIDGIRNKNIRRRCCGFPSWVKRVHLRNLQADCFVVEERYRGLKWILCRIFLVLHLCDDFHCGLVNRYGILQNLVSRAHLILFQEAIPLAEGRLGAGFELGFVHCLREQGG
mmetsp:Transcript_28407/g.69243  ORF Transcript_28407/g.69243 Transcript_28407/m.69243 type:complete len:353 (+) Transcript_28407:366-1424(+)